MSDVSIRQRIWIQGWKDGACGFPAVHIRNTPEHDGLYDAGHAEGLKARAVAQKQAELVDAPLLQPRGKPSRRRQQSLFGDDPKAKGAVSVFVQYREAFAAGLEEAVGRAFVVPNIKGPDDPFVRALGAFAVKDGAKLGGAELLGWIRWHAKVWATTTVPGRFPLHEFVAWLNEGGHVRHVPQKPKEPERQELSSTPIAPRRAARR